MKLYLPYTGNIYSSSSKLQNGETPFLEILKKYLYKKDEELNTFYFLYVSSLVQFLAFNT